jgi:predicted membrane protein
MSAVTNRAQLERLVALSSREAGKEAILMMTLVWGFLVAGFILLLYFGLVQVRAPNLITISQILFGACILACAICYLIYLALNQKFQNAKLELKKLLAENEKILAQ